MSDEIVPTASRRKVVLEDQAELVRKLANRCTLSDGSLSAETLVFLNGEAGEVLTAAANTLESLIPVKDDVRRVVWNEQQKRGRR